MRLFNVYWKQRKNHSYVLSLQKKRSTLFLMMRKIRYPKSFSKKASKLVEKNPELKESLRKIIHTLERDVFEPFLRTHALSGKLKGLHSCYLNKEIRVIFKITDDTVSLFDIGTHDEVYKTSL
ncbi:MAG: type II toxin-antitoxin system mRNA interferase toxin, RelE/StbE family [Candidatus Magnetobacterium sp. LHC-1]